MNVSREEAIVENFALMLLEKICETEDFSTVESHGIMQAMRLLCQGLERAYEHFDELIFRERDLRFKSAGFEKRHVLTTAGLVMLKRRRYRSDIGSVYLLDEAVDLPAKVKISPQLARMSATFGTNTSFQEAADSLEYYIASGLSKMTIARLLKQNADLLEEVQTKELHPKIETPVLDVEADGCFVPLQRTRAQKQADRVCGKKRKRAYKEVGMYSAFTGKERVGTNRKKRCNVLHFATTDAPKDAWDEFGNLLGRKYETQNIYCTNLAADGDVSYLNGARVLFGEVSVGYDLHHIPTSIAQTLGVDIAREVYATMKEIGFSEGFDVLKTYADDFFADTGHEKYVDIISFVQKHEGAMRVAFKYNLGTIEGTNAHIIGSRCKRFGGGWGPRLDPIVRLRAAFASGVRPGLAHRARKVSLPDIVKNRMLQEAQNYIATLEARAKKNRSRISPSDFFPEYYHQAPIAHRSKNERCYSLLKKWA